MGKSRPSRTPSLLRLLRLVPAGIGALLFMVALSLVDSGIDFAYNYRPAVRAWLFEGRSLYGGGSYVFYNPPWTAFFLLPFSLLPASLGKAALAGFTLAVLAATTVSFAAGGKLRLLALGLVLPHFHTLYVTLEGQIDAFPLLGILVGWWAVAGLHPRLASAGTTPEAWAQGKAPWLLGLAFVLLSIKPQVVFLVAGVYLLALRKVPWRGRLVAVSLPLLAVVTSLPLFGADWPVRWWQAYSILPPVPEHAVTTWRAARELGLPPWTPLPAVAAALVGGIAVYRRLGLSQDTVGLALVTGAVAASFSSPSSSLLLLAVPFARLLALRPALALLVYALSLTPPWRVPHGLSIAWIDSAFWWALWLATFAVLWTQGRGKPTEEQAHA
ncbi:MAG: hypothetical protein HY689_12245 [Chloroflexi bacterium]|nr:hypothetical protein [Chloroflexota bacterium]